MNLSFWKNKKVLVTGHTGFKGSWLCFILKELGANVCGYSLNPPANPNLFGLINIQNNIKHINGDILDYDKMLSVFSEFLPEIVFHLAAQPIVKVGYGDPRLTYSVNVLGVVNVLDCIKNTPSVKSVVNVTTDKVYKNFEWERGYREDDILDGNDPYSNSKSCSELVTSCYKKSFLGNIAVSCARAGNVIGGGDFAEERIIPDCVRAAQNNQTLFIRNPNSVRPYQHVLEPLFAYLMIAEKQYADKSFEGCYNIGPEDSGCVTTGGLVELFIKYYGNGFKYEIKNILNIKEANFLKLNCYKIKNKFNYKPIIDIGEAVRLTVEWTKAYFENKDVSAVMRKQINDYMQSITRNA